MHPRTPLDDAAWPYGFFAEVHKWPPTVVDEQPWWLIEQLPIVHRAYGEAAELARERAEAKAKQG